MLEARRHQVDAAHPGQLEQLLDGLRADPQPLRRRPGPRARRAAAGPARPGPAPRARWPPGAPARGSSGPAPRRPGSRSAGPGPGRGPRSSQRGEPRHVEHVLGLHELGARRHLLGQPRAEPAGGANGFSTAPISQSGGGGQRPAGQQPALVAHGRGRPAAAARCPGRTPAWPGVVAEPRVVAGHQQHVAVCPARPRPSRSDCSAIRLRSRQVSCMTGSTPAASASTLPAQAGHPDVRALVVGDVDRVHPAAQRRRPAAPIAAGSAPRGGPISAVTTTSPDASRLRSAAGRLTGAAESGMARVSPGEPA